MSKKAYKTEASLPKNLRIPANGRSINYSGPKNPPVHINSQNMEGRKTDLDRLIEHGLSDVNFMRNFLVNSTQRNVLDYAQQCVESSPQLNDEDREEILELIARRKAQS